jgi:hypothetical protein
MAARAACASHDEVSDLVGVARYLVDAGLIADELNRVIGLPALDERPEVVVVPNRVQVPYHLVAIPTNCDGDRAGYPIARRL